MKMLVAFVLFCAVASSQASNGLKWQSCGGSALVIKKLDIAQDKITFPGPIDVVLEAGILKDMVAPIKVSVTMKKGGIKLPCVPIDGKMVGSCVYDDICQTMEKIPEDCKGASAQWNPMCLVLGKIISAARCPIKKNPNVSIKNGHVMLPKLICFAAFIFEGVLEIEVKTKDATGTLLGCIQIAADLHFGACGPPPVVINQCRSSPCQNGGTCTDKVNRFECKCKPGWTGITCLENINECQSSPCQNGGTCIDKVNRFECECKRGWTGVTCLSPVEYRYVRKYMDWNAAQKYCRGLGFSGSLAVVSSDATMREVRKFQNANDVWIGLSERKDGKTWETPDHLVNHYHGWDQGQPEPWKKGELEEKCASQLNSGKWHDYPCKWKKYFICQFIPNINECESSPCQNGGTCTNKVNGFECKCNPGWTGVTCRENINECESSPCQNGGTCTDKVNGFECKCNPGWTGVTCRENINECRSSPCQNGGTCTDKVNRFECKCKPGWTGIICLENINECQSSPCQNGGTCIDKVNIFECKCKRGWTGITCLKSTHGRLPICEGYEIVNGRYVKYFDRKMTWQSAKDFCKSSSSQLITVKDEKTAEWLKGQQKPIWIGACDLGHEGKWTWVDGTQVEDGNWNADEPNNGLGMVDENCAVVNSMFYPWWDHGKWADRACSLKKRFACETVRCPDLKIVS